MTNDEMYLAVTKMTEAEYMKFLADKAGNIQKNSIKYTSYSREIKFPHPEEESPVSQNTDTIKSKFDDDEIEIIKYALAYLHDADLSSFKKEEIEALENVMNKFYMKFSSVVDLYYMDDGSRQY